MQGWVAALIVFLVIALCAYIGVGCYFWGESGAYDQGYNVGNNDGYDIGYSQGYTTGQVEGWEEGYNIGWDEGYAGPLRLFESLEELQSWILRDDTDSLVHIAITFDCDDFAMRLSQNAANDKYFIGLYLEQRLPRHMKNFAYIEGKTDVVYLIEPQDDRIAPLRVDIYGLVIAH